LCLFLERVSSRDPPEAVPAEAGALLSSLGLYSPPARKVTGRLPDAFNFRNAANKAKRRVMTNVEDCPNAPPLG